MTQEGKELLLKDLCARLPYGVKVTWDGLYPITLTPSIYGELWKEKRDQNIPKVYLRQMSSMTEEEIETYRIIIKSLLEKSVTDNVATLYNFLNSKHLDYNALIPQGLALQVPEGMY